MAIATEFNKLRERVQKLEGPDVEGPASDELRRIIFEIDYQI
jgi:hypothetical protein